MPNPQTGAEQRFASVMVMIFMLPWVVFGCMIGEGIPALALWAATAVALIRRPRCLPEAIVRRLPAGRSAGLLQASDASVVVGTSPRPRVRW
jgi:hypothetical protein